jgi:ubiquinone/menaquinone biosynthesis C-methylase UbiE/DNA-binding transcriptional ArsR family regulator
MPAPLEIFRSLADPTRLRIITLLRSMELSVGELAQVLGQSQPRVSRHVKILVDAGLVDRRKEGAWVFIALARGDAVAALLSALDSWTALAGGDYWAIADNARLAAVRADRATAAERWFEAHAVEWDAIRSLHVAESEVEAAMQRALDGSRVGRLVDIGTGTGRMIELFGGAAETALGIDRSPEMLRVARAKLTGAVPAAELRQGDMYALPLGDGSADCVILHQVLHFAQQPAAAIAEGARLLAPGGRMLIVDFAPHEREELRTQDAHARLGFADAAVLRWLNDAGLDGQICEHLTGGELTVTLWLGTRPAARAVRAA